MIKTPRWIFIFTLFILLSSSILSACSAANSAEASTSSGDMSGLAMASLKDMPAEVKSAPVTVQQGYEYALANPDALKQIPCYCGCGKVGHTSNYSCYIKDVDSSGEVNYDLHATGCSLCVDITQDVMRLQKEKKPIQEIRAYIDDNYSKYGPSNMSSSLIPSGPGAQNAANTSKPGVCDISSGKACVKK